MPGRNAANIFKLIYDEIYGKFGATTDAPASASADEDTTARGVVSLLKGCKNLLIDLVGGPVGYHTKRVNVTFTAIGAYSQYDNVGGLVEIPNWARSVGRSATIREARISVNKNDITPQFELHFFNASDATVAADNATWTEIAAEYAKRAGYIIMNACAKATGSGTIDMVRTQSDDYGLALSKEVVCAAGSTSAWLALKLLNSGGVTFANAPGNTIAVAMVIEQS